jgi:cleavage and polyadenylation specificity factor subunit 4
MPIDPPATQVAFLIISICRLFCDRKEANDRSMLLDRADDLKFNFEDDLAANDAATMVRKNKEICPSYQTGTCTNGDQCPYRHVVFSGRSQQAEVCRHWLRGVCVNGVDCPYLHEYDARLLPECVFYSKLGECTNPECTFRHISPEERTAKCAAYERGFCPQGPKCTLRHVFRPVCPNYMAGFCYMGPQCKKGHPVQLLYDEHRVYERLKVQMIAENDRNPNFNPNVQCHRCRDPGHISRACPGPQQSVLRHMMMQMQEPGDVVIATQTTSRGCFYCREEGHTMRDCPKRPRVGGDRPGDRRQDGGMGGMPPPGGMMGPPPGMSYHPGGGQAGGLLDAPAPQYRRTEM